jgi:glyoxylase-like metal-dependent hydrolase (beta-lactamase superfamily II)
MKVFQYPTIPKPELIGEKLYRVVLPQPFYAPNNIYVILADEPAIIDSGFILNLGMLQKALKQIKLSLKNIKHIFYTHNHIDHISAALTLKHYTNAKMYAMKGMSRSIGNYIEDIQNFNRGEMRLFYKAISSIEERKRRVQEIHQNWSEFYKVYKTAKKVDTHLPIDVELVQGDVIDIGGREIGFLYTPGHNRWHLSPYLLGEGIYFTGDLVLNNISSIYAEIDGNLDDYHHSLERLVRLPIKRLLPAHGEEPEDPKRAIKLLSKTLAILERGVTRRLKEGGEYDLGELANAAMGDKIQNSPYYVVALAIMHSIVLKYIAQGSVVVHEVDPPYEKYKWV